MTYSATKNKFHLKLLETQKSGDTLSRHQEQAMSERPPVESPHVAFDGGKMYTQTHTNDKGKTPN